MKLEDYAFPVPPVCTAKWTDADWLRWAQANGTRLRCCCRATLSGETTAEGQVKHGAHRCTREVSP